MEEKIEQVLRLLAMDIREYMSQEKWVTEAKRALYPIIFSNRVELPVILQVTKIIDGLADEYSNEQKLAYMGNDQKIIRENDIKINTLMELKRTIDKSNWSK